MNAELNIECLISEKIKLHQDMNINNFIPRPFLLSEFCIIINTLVLVKDSIMSIYQNEIVHENMKMTILCLILLVHPSTFSFGCERFICISKSI